MKLEILLDVYGLNRQKVAALLFQNSKHPLRALTRVLDGEQELKQKQLETLRYIINGDPLSYGFNFVEAPNWKADEGKYYLERVASYPASPYTALKAEVSKRDGSVRVYSPGGEIDVRGAVPDAENISAELALHYVALTLIIYGIRP